MPTQPRVIVPESFNFPRTPEKTRDYAVREFISQLLVILTDMATEFSTAINIKMFIKYGDTFEGKLDFSSSGYIILPLRAGDPIAPETGRIWYDTVSNLFRGKKVAGIRTLLTNDEGLIKQGDTFLGLLDFSGTSGRFKVPVYAGDPAAPANGEVWYDSVGNIFRRRRNGVSETW